MPFLPTSISHFPVTVGPAWTPIPYPVSRLMAPSQTTSTMVEPCSSLQISLGIIMEWARWPTILSFRMFRRGCPPLPCTLAGVPSAPTTSPYLMTGFGMDPLISDPFFTGPNEPWNNAQHVVAPPPAPIAAPPPAPIAATPPASGNRIACSSPGCGKTFRRAGDCRRHMLKHGPPRFICPLNGCTMPFTRADKLRDHLRQGHKINQTCQRSSA
jgi:hypothetical protein